MGIVDCGLETKHVVEDVQISDNVSPSWDASVLNPESAQSVESTPRCGSEQHDPGAHEADCRFSGYTHC